MADFPRDVSANELAVLWGIASRNVQRLATDGIIPRSSVRGRFPLKESTVAYLHDLREKAAGRAAGEGGMTLAAQRSRLTDLQAQEQELKVQKLRGDVISRDEATEGWTKIARAAKAAFLALPSKIRFAIPHLTAHDAVVLGRLCRESLEDVANELEGDDIPGVGSENGLTDEP
ncbi:hypothetical protein [Microvirga brassicacearum]|uniref:Terminase small subunit, Nu1 n=1 Tax=Microvirga brassicacearum TaxID=2580413 RepID=A0A5N3PH72_9HYPH|nr:hypothetical protein [Microvirga brassicacearum]KAB0269053.1 hypothetical protein FEZ63_02800 [Microvirga brassicacearum]